MERRPLLPSDARIALALAGLLAVLLGLVATGTSDALDASVAARVAPHVPRSAEEAADQLTHLSDGRSGVAVGILAILGCGLLGGLRGALVAGCLVLAANVCGLLLDPHFVRDLTWDGRVVTTVPASAPSNHAVLSSSLAVGAVLATPRRWRPVAVGLGASWIVLIAGCVLALRTHVLSDVVTGWTLTGLWTVVALRLRRGLPTSPARAWVRPPTWARGVGAVVLVALAAVGAALSGVASDASDAIHHRGAYLAAIGLCALVAVAAAGASTAAQRMAHRSREGRPPAG